MGPEREAIQSGNRDHEPHETSGSDGDDESENGGEAIVDALTYSRSEITEVNSKIELTRKKLQSLREIGKKAEEMQSEDDLGNEEDGQKKREEMHQRLKDLQDQEKRVTKLRKLHKNVLETRAGGPGISRPDVLGFEMMMMQQRILRRGRDLYDYFMPPRFGNRFDDSGSESMDDDESQQDKTETQNFLGLLERLTSYAQMLEVHIQRIRGHIFTLDDTVHLRQTLEREHRLECEWRDNLSFPNKVGEHESSSTEQGSHFLGVPIPKEIYKPLEKNQFRVLALVSAPEPYYPLICTLEVWSLDDVSSTSKKGKTYAALSYFWGPEAYNGRIYLLPSDDVPSSSDAEAWGLAIAKASQIRIRNNLFRALLRLRRHGPKANTVALWVDYMCINQKDDEEKTTQLSRMVNIYSNASNVCIWLGESDSGGRSDEAMEFIATIMDFAILDRNAHDKKQAKKWYALGELMRDRWFSRRWVVQEVALSKDATVHCGGKSVRWSDFADAASLIVSNQETIKSLFDFSEWREGRNTLGDVDSFGASILLEATNKLFRRKAGGEIKRPIKTIESLVTSLKTFDTGDPRDLIYSVVSIASDTSRHLWDPENNPETGLGLVVDYKKSNVDVYKEFTKFCVLSTKSYGLDIICRPWAMPLKDETGIKVNVPSWIPRLSNTEFGVPEEVYSGRRNGEVLVGPAGSPNYNACGTDACIVTFGPRQDRNSVLEPEQSQLPGADNIPASVEADDTNFVPGNDENTLFAKGFRLARIQEVSARNTGGVILRESLRMGGWEGFKRNTDSVPDPIWRTLVADRDQDGQVPPSWYQRACLRCLEVADTFNNGDLNVGELLQGDSEMLRKYLVRVRNVTWNRRFFKAAVQKFVEKTVEEGKERMEKMHGSKGTSEAGGSDKSNVEKLEDQNVQKKEAEEEIGPAEEEEEECSSNTEEAVKNVDNEERIWQKREDEKEDEKGVGELGEVEVRDADEESDKKTDGKADEEVNKGADKVNENTDEESSEEADDEADDEADEERSETEEEEAGEAEKETEENEGEQDVEEYKSDTSQGSFENSTSAKSDEEEEREQEKLFGICPPESRSGDLICILHGCSVPVVLRQEEHGYMRLVGEAYVHGKMDGEAVEDFRDNNAWEDEDFRLQ